MSDKKKREWWATGYKDEFPILFPSIGAALVFIEGVKQARIKKDTIPLFKVQEVLSKKKARKKIPNEKRSRRTKTK